MFKLATLFLACLAVVLAQESHLRSPSHDLWLFKKSSCKKDLTCYFVKAGRSDGSGPSRLHKLYTWCWNKITFYKREDGYSVECTTSDHIDRMTFFYDEGDDGKHDESVAPYTMRGDSNDGGLFVNQVYQFVKPGVTKFDVKVKVDENTLYTKSYTIKLKCPWGTYLKGGACVKYSWCKW